MDYVKTTVLQEDCDGPTQLVGWVNSSQWAYRGTSAYGELWLTAGVSQACTIGGGSLYYGNPTKLSYGGPWVFFGQFDRWQGNLTEANRMATHFAFIGGNAGISVTFSETVDLNDVTLEMANLLGEGMAAWNGWLSYWNENIGTDVAGSGSTVDLFHVDGVISLALDDVVIGTVTGGTIGDLHLWDTFQVGVDAPDGVEISSIQLYTLVAVTNPSGAGLVKVTNGGPKTWGVVGYQTVAPGGGVSVDPAGGYSWGGVTNPTGVPPADAPPVFSTQFIQSLQQSGVVTGAFPYQGQTAVGADGWLYEHRSGSWVPIAYLGADWEV